MNKQDLKIVFLGTPEFAVPSLAALVDGGYDVAAVITMPDKLAGRGHKLIESEVKKYAVARGLRVLQPVNLKDPAFQQELRSIGADLFIVIAFRMLPEAVWRMPRMGTFNLHASLLPRYRGAAPINHAIINGDTETGVTTFFLKHDIDTGNIIEQRSIPIGPDENVGSLYDRLMHLGAEMVIDTVNRIISTDGNVPVIPQPEGEFLPAPKIFTDTCHIDWNRPREQVRNLIRGLSPYPAAFTMIANEKGETAKLKVFASEPVELPESAGLTPGDIVARPGKLLAVMCADGLLQLTDVQLQGKKRMSAGAFLLGYHLCSHIPSRP